MEGLIPFIYKAIKEKRSRTCCRCSSSTDSARRFGAGGEDVDDVWEQKQRGVVRAADVDTAARKADGGQYSPAEREMTHRRHRSLEELAGEVGTAPEWPRARGLPRGRSVKIFSCIGGM